MMDIQQESISTYGGRNTDKLTILRTVYSPGQLRFVMKPAVEAYYPVHLVVLPTKYIYI